MRKTCLIFKAIRRWTTARSGHLIAGFFLLLMMFSENLQGQHVSRKQLEKEKKENLRKIEQTRKILREVKKEKKVSISQLLALRQQEKQKEKISLKDFNLELQYQKMR